jgi:hypothetical protein
VQASTVVSAVEQEVACSSHRRYSEVMAHMSIERKSGKHGRRALAVEAQENRGTSTRAKTGLPGSSIGSRSAI